MWPLHGMPQPVQTRFFFAMVDLDNKKKLNNYQRLVMDEIKAWREKLIEAWLFRFFCELFFTSRAVFARSSARWKEKLASENIEDSEVSRILFV